MRQCLLTANLKINPIPSNDQDIPSTQALQSVTFPTYLTILSASPSAIIRIPASTNKLPNKPARILVNTYSRLTPCISGASFAGVRLHALVMRNILITSSHGDGALHIGLAEFLPSL